MYLKEEDEIRDAVQKLVRYAVQCNLPWAEMADKVEQKLRLHPTPGTSPEVARQLLRQIIEEEVQLARNVHSALRSQFP